MSKYYVLFNPLAGNKTGEESAKKLLNVQSLKDENLIFADMTKIESYKDFMDKIEDDDKLILAGGDGTINRFVNDTADIKISNDIYYYATGTGNDFLHELNIGQSSSLILINKYIASLPTVTVNGKKQKFLNGIGFGIDGYCCEIGDKLRETSDKPVNYTSIAIKGLLFYYKPTSATVTVDGKKHHFKKVWIAPTMNGKFYGGGMMTAPDQDRLNEDGTLTTVLMHGAGRLRTLMVFPSIFKGEHIKHTKTVAVLTGREIEVEFDSPRALQIDGETVLGVKKYSVSGISRRSTEATASLSSDTAR
jgi:diacylglycerol kinase family enzyme